MVNGTTHRLDFWSSPSLLATHYAQSEIHGSCLHRVPVPLLMLAWFREKGLHRLIVRHKTGAHPGLSGRTDAFTPARYYPIDPARHLMHRGTTTLFLYSSGGIELCHFMIIVSKSLTLYEVNVTVTAPKCTRVRHPLSWLIFTC
jgi:hypothetical protein